METRDRWMTGNTTQRLHGPANRPLLVAASATVGLQSVAAVFFVIDCYIDFVELGRSPAGIEIFLEGGVTLALIGGIALGIHYVRGLIADVGRKEAALSVARGAVADHVRKKFDEWKLSPSEADVAMLAIKGFQIAEIARLRGAAAGTVRSQMSQVYSKAGVSSQSMLVASFLDDLLDGGAAADRNDGAKPA